MRCIQSSNLDAVAALLRNSTVPTQDVVRSVISFAHEDIRIAMESDAPRNTHAGDTPGLEAFLWGMWEDVLDIAEENASNHDRLVDFVGQLGERGDEACENWRVWGTAVHWAELPMLGPVARDAVNGPTTRGIDIHSEIAHGLLSGDAPDIENDAALAISEVRRRYLNVQQFLARLWNETNFNIDVYGIWAMREGLEHDPASPSSASSSQPRDLSLEIAAIWIDYAGNKMYRFRGIYGPKGDPDWDPAHGRPGTGGARWDGVDGYDPARWALWKEVFNEVANEEGRRPNVTAAAKAGFKAMVRVENAAK